MRWTTWHLLALVDKLLGTRLVARALARRQVRIEQLVTQLETVNQELEALSKELDFYQLAICLAELKARQHHGDLKNWLRFAPGDDEELLDSAIAVLVKPGLATVDAEPVGPNRYAHYLRPDWSAIIQQLRAPRREAVTVAPELISWLEEQTQS